jgi:sec-independent protein translocase protein TatB
MFDVGFSELVLIGIVALLVLGPERLPKVARAAGLWAGRARRFLSTVKADIDREIKAEELRQIMQKQAESSGIHEIVEQTRTAVGEIKGAATDTVTSAGAAITPPPDVTATVSGVEPPPAAPQAPPAAPLSSKPNDQ